MLSFFGDDARARRAAIRHRRAPSFRKVVVGV